jgi:hypothetical protein
MADYRQYIKFEGSGKTLRPDVRKTLRKIPMDKLSEQQTRALAVEGSYNSGNFPFPGRIFGDAIEVVETIDIDAIEAASIAENLEKIKSGVTPESIRKFMKECRCGRHDSYRKLEEATKIDKSLIWRHANGKTQPRAENLGLYEREYLKCQGHKITVAGLESPKIQQK